MIGFMAPLHPCIPTFFHASSCSICFLISMDWFRGKSTGFFFGNHGSFPPDMGFPVDFPLNQSSHDGKTMVKTDDSFPMIIVFQQIWWKQGYPPFQWLGGCHGARRLCHFSLWSHLGSPRSSGAKSTRWLETHQLFIGGFHSHGGTPKIDGL